MTEPSVLVMARGAVPEPDTARPAGAAVTVLFALTSLIGAGLLFVVQPMVAKLLLPSYGGSATVWSTSSLFFQVLLLVAYWYVHASTTRFGARWQPGLHLPLLVLPLLFLPLALPADAAPAADSSPALWLLRTLALLIGLPFAVVATTGPVLQRWYSWTGHRRSDDPYFLFATSNLGSFAGLLAYPLLIEPRLPLVDQRTWWSWGFVGFVLLTAACGLVAARAGRRTSEVSADSGAAGDSTRGSDPTPVGAVSASPATGRGEIALWAALAFLPSTLMLGVTAHLSTDVAAIPLLWVVPLAIYLTTFIAAFAHGSRRRPVRLTRAAVGLGFVALVLAVYPGVASIPVHLAVSLTMLALVGYAAHARLAAHRPAADRLTTYYLVIAAGGALGGLLNGLVAPVVFDRVLEYPLALAAVPLLALGLGDPDRSPWLVRHSRANRVRAMLVVLGMVLLALGFRYVLDWAREETLISAAILVLGVGLGWWLSTHAAAMTAALVLFYAAAGVLVNPGVLEQTRTFFGTYTVKAEGDQHTLVHGTTVHGTQFRDPQRRSVPTTYYARSGPLGDVFGLDGRERFDDVAVVGLGTGTVAAYGRDGQSMTFFEIDPRMVELAQDPALFSYLSDSAADIETVVGDGRLEVAERPRGSYDLMLLDAFSSDAIPAHLLTVEAMKMYAERLGPDGILAVHISNRVFDLEPVVAAAAEELGWSAAIGRGSASEDGATGAVWMVLSPHELTLTQLAGNSGWDRSAPDRLVRWTDSYSSVLSVLR